MTDKEYLLRLDLALSGLSFEKRLEVLESVGGLFESASQKGYSYNSVVKRLGSPEVYGKKVLENFDSNLALASSFSSLESKKAPLKEPSLKPKTESWWEKGLLGLILIFLFPLPIGCVLIAIGLFLSLIMVFLSLVLAFISGILGSIIVFGKGIYLLGHDPLGAVFDFGATLFGIGLTWLLGLLIQGIMKVAWPKFCEWFKELRQSLRCRINRIRRPLP